MIHVKTEAGRLRYKSHAELNRDLNVAWDNIRKYWEVTPRSFAMEAQLSGDSPQLLPPPAKTKRVETQPGLASLVPELQPSFVGVDAKTGRSPPVIR